MACENPESKFSRHVRGKHLALFLRLLLILSVLCLKYFVLVADGRAIPVPKQLVARTDDFQGVVDEEVVAVMVEEGRMIGSRPPICDQKCGSCGHCKAVQVPVAAAGVKHHQLTTDSDEIHLSRAQETAHTAYWRGDDFSNYKPMCWKCKCGSLMFNP